MTYSGWGQFSERVIFIGRLEEYVRCRPHVAGNCIRRSIVPSLGH